ncbi:hypothetical protein FE374_11525 [Georgenia yuyongxinii]|uniref:Flavodoxin-like domain-containing protein n=1 Tax=Georgenia yuyongxinii TaxID=2589797 RepID=A0A5B8C4C2_9MICO|nr:hypothetical protein [Georgenia yuyongxinii]QDC25148.1 hypothetical protein FE374_11525 [Georgenia yuyongxinii]
MKIPFYYASMFGNGTAGADVEHALIAKGVAVDVHHIRDADPTALPPADLHVFSSPGRMGRPLGRARRFLKHAKLPTGARYALLTTAGAPRPDKKAGEMPTAEEIARWQSGRS